MSAKARRRPVAKFGAVWCRKKPSRLNVRACIYWCRGTELNCRHGDFQSFDTVLYFKNLHVVRTKLLGASHFSTPFSTPSSTPHLARFWASPIITNALLRYAMAATPASLAAVAYEVALICTTGGNDPCPPTWPRPYLSPCEASPGRQTRLTAMRGTKVFHPASHKTPRLTSGPVLSASISNSLSFKHPAPASRPQY